jgi:hypothetical protein
LLQNITCQAEKTGARVLPTNGRPIEIKWLGVNRKSEECIRLIIIDLKVDLSY